MTIKQMGKHTMAVPEFENGITMKVTLPFLVLPKKDNNPFDAHREGVANQFTAMLDL